MARRGQEAYSITSSSRARIGGGVTSLNLQARAGLKISRSRDRALPIISKAMKRGGWEATFQACLTLPSFATGIEKASPTRGVTKSTSSRRLKSKNPPPRRHAAADLSGRSRAYALHVPSSAGTAAAGTVCGGGVVVLGAGAHPPIRPVSKTNAECFMLRGHFLALVSPHPSKPGPGSMPVSAANQGRRYTARGKNDVSFHRESFSR